MSSDPVHSAWPAPYAEGLTSPWIGTLLMNLPIALALLDSSGRIVTGNDAMQVTAGQTWRPGMRPETMVVGDDAAMLSRAVADVLAGGEPHTLRLTLAERPDEVRDINVMPVPAGFGAAALIAMRDIREQMRLEAQVAAVTRLQAVGQLAGGVAHDFNNLLTAILGHAEQLLDRFPIPARKMMRLPKSCTTVSAAPIWWANCWPLPGNSRSAGNCCACANWRRGCGRCWSSCSARRSSWISSRRKASSSCAPIRASWNR